jgi:hypothetical protein
MRIDHRLNPVPLGINSRQHLFLGAWFNLVHQHSLDSYRVRVMNPLNILRELSRMFEPPADENDCRIVAAEALEILNRHPVMIARAEHYVALDDAVSLLSEAVHAKEGGFKKSALLLKSFMRELEGSLGKHFLRDCFEWMERALAEIPGDETAQQRGVIHSGIDRVCRDILSVAHDEGFSLESLFHLYRAFVPSPERGSASETESAQLSLLRLTADQGGEAPVVPSPAVRYDFAERFARVKRELLNEPRERQLIFVISGCTDEATDVCCGDFGAIRISKVPPELPEQTPAAAKNLFSDRPRRLFATARVRSRDGRSASLDAYRQIGQILDLMRFEYDTPQIQASTRFLLHDEGKFLLLQLPQLIPNPEAEPPTRSLQEFVEHLGRLAARDPSQTETKDRIFSAFRLYRLGTGTSMFDNKLVNWWTGLEYLTSGSKTGGGIGEKVKNALAPTLALTYLPKHLVAFRTALATLDVEVLSQGATVPARDCSNGMFYAALRDITQRPALEASCAQQPYLWKHLSAFMESLESPAKTAEMLRAHDRRVRWQIERIYRARCDIVHAARQVVMASLLCANLEYYLRMTLKSMLKVFAGVPTLTGPAEFFERQRHRFEQVLLGLDPTDKRAKGSDSSLVALLD